MQSLNQIIHNIKLKLTYENGNRNSLKNTKHIEHNFLLYH